MKKQFAVLCLLPLLLSPRLTQLVSAQQTSAAPSESKTLRLAGLKKRVTVRRDERGIPYIEATNESDLYFAQGYVTASDRLFQMELFRRSARGELAEIFGAGPQGSVLESDKQHRRFGFAQLAEAQVARLSPRLRAALEDYARGVNAFIESLDAKTLPPEFQILQLRPRPWRPADSLLIGKNFDEALTTSWRADLTRAAFAELPAPLRAQLFPESSPLDVILVGSDARKRASLPVHNSSDLLTGEALTAPDLDALAFNESSAQSTLELLGLYAKNSDASNNWVVSGKLTETGKPLLANDPHLSPSAPSIWYMTELSAPSYHVAGVSVAGIPGVAIGHNEAVAWGVTSLEPDVQDLYVETFDKDNPQRYKTPEGWRQAEVRHEEIKVRKSPAGTATETVPLDVWVTRHGPIIFEQGGKRYALRWTALDPDANLGESFFLLNLTRNWNDFRAALRNYSGPAFNMIYADTKGHIGYYGAGRFPIRKTGNGKLPYDGATDEGEWTGFIPFEALPHVYDPPGGIIVTANTRIVGFDYPYDLTVIPGPAYRTRRINDLLHAAKKLSVEDFRRIQGDTYTFSGATFAREVGRVAQEDNSPASKDEKWVAAVNLLKEWDGRVVPESRAALLVSFMRQAFRDQVIKAKVGTELARRYSYSNADTLIDRLITERPIDWLPKEFKSYAELLHECLAEARSALTKGLGPDETNWTWGQQSKVTFPHPLSSIPLIGQQFAIPPFPQNGSGGSLSTVNRGSNVSMRFIADLSDWDNSQQGIALGVSGIPSSPHWKDQLEDWRKVTPRAFPFSKAAVASAAKETWVFEPAN
ncbi:MAG TPA: penicillin acylase family protein [Pyrinomonadaceae bacterium]|nr:penicillin acylase family protein [Pyrinomonadaceae bacterium]